MTAVKRILPRVIAEKQVDFVVANGENTAGGVGITPELARDLLDLGVHCITTGNHIWRYAEIKDYIDREPRLIRPMNYPERQPGSGMGVYETPAGVKVAVVNLAGRVYMDPAENPFLTADAAFEKIPDVKIRLVDFHAEATSESRAMGFYLEGRCTAVVGTHTHTQTADEQVLPKGTAYITDMGMTGPHDSVIGMRKELILERFVSGLPHPFRLAKKGARFQGVVIEASAETGVASAIERIDIPMG